jgi:2-polyprenyl-3-methyl-5-hydroxy-6-metoxy-1,4-benzoquinol methylase
MLDRTDPEPFSIDPGSFMLDVDGQVISAEALAKRVQSLVESIDAGTLADGVSSQSGDPTLDGWVAAMRHAHSQLHPPDISSPQGLRGHVGAFFKRIVRRLTSWYVEPRWVLQQQIDAQAIAFASALSAVVARSDAELAELRRQNARLRLQAVISNERGTRALHDIGDLSQVVAEQANVLEGVAMQDDLRPLNREVTALLDRLGAIGSSGADINYTDFEDVFRGASSEVEKAQERYLTLFPPASDPGKVVDIGCGRGEMLTLLAREGYDVVGVDLDPAMVEVCKKKGLEAFVDDGIHFLSKTRDDALKGIFCAQVVEHLLTPELEQLVRLAHRTLRVSGVLVVETINPRSSFALGNHFYADTSHVRPVHPETLRFICEQIGFRRVQLEERSPHPMLQLAKDLPDDAAGEAIGELLRNVFGYQDYVIVATK